MRFKLKGDDNYHVYEIELSASPRCKGAITDLRIGPVPISRNGDQDNDEA